MKDIRDALSESQFAALIDRYKAAAAEQGNVFVLDEAPQLWGQRQQAAYLRRLAHSVHMDELAARLDPDEFPPGPYEAFMAEQQSFEGT